MHFQTQGFFGASVSASFLVLFGGREKTVVAASFRP